MTFKNMEGDMDFDTSPLLRGESDLQEMASGLTSLVLATAAGKKTKSEDLGHKEFFIPYKYQDSQAKKKQFCKGNS